MKLQIMKVKPTLTDEEIQSYMDFDGLLKKHQAASPFGRWKLFAWAAGSLLIATSLYLFTRMDSEPPKSSLQTEKPSAPAEPKENESTAPPDSAYRESTAQKEQPPQVKPSAKVKTKPSITAVPSAKDTYQEAEPVEGFASLYNYFNLNLKYPENHLKDKIEGVEIISFVIDETGQPTNLKVVQSLGAAFDDEARRLVKTMPAWKPAMLNGRAVPSKLSLPFTFSIAK